MTEFTDTMGRMRTRSLFVELIDQKQIDAGFIPLYTIRENPAYIDMRSLYLVIGDITEYQFAIKAFGSWKHFKHMCTLGWFMALLSEWREELEIKIRSQAVQALIDTAVREGAKGTTAAKYVAEKGWMKKRGRPSNEDVERERKIQAGIKDDLSDDAKRIGLH